MGDEYIYLIFLVYMIYLRFCQLFKSRKIYKYVPVDNVYHAYLWAHDAGNILFAEIVTHLSLMLSDSIRPRNS